MADLGDEIGKQFPLPEQIEFAQILSIWTHDKRATWLLMNRIRSDILASGASSVSEVCLARHAAWLQDLADRTYPLCQPLKEAWGSRPALTASHRTAAVIFMHLSNWLRSNGVRCHPSTVQSSR